jgi:hypothetical protein
MVAVIGQRSDERDDEAAFAIPDSTNQNAVKGA